MKKSINLQIEDIKNEVNYIGKSIAKNATKHVREDMAFARKQIIDDFYSYKIKSPEHNSRTWLLKYAVRMDNEKKIIGNSGSASLKIDASLIGGQEYGHGKKENRVSPEYVTDLIWYEGIRGLPEKGTTPLSHDFNAITPDGVEHFKEGELWHNTYWNQSEYENEFRTRIHIGSFISKKKDTPHNIMMEFVNHWGDKRGIDVFDKAVLETKVKLKKH